MIFLFIQLVIAVWLLTLGADWFTRAAALLTKLTGLSRLLLGAVLIGFSTNIPEFAISLGANWSGQHEIALANPVGSIIVDTGLVLGLCLFIGRIKLEDVWLYAHGIPMLFSALLLYVLALWGDITPLSGFVLSTACVVYTWTSIIRARKNPQLAAIFEESTSEFKSDAPVHRDTGWTATLLLTLIGGAVVLVSSRWVLDSATELARTLQVSETVIGLSIIAVGTSLPELATALSAMKKGHHDTSLGIIFGSNIYNALGVVGLSALIGTLPVTTANLLFDFPVMLLVLFIPFWGMKRNLQPSHLKGLVLMSVYAVYTYALYTLYGIFKP